MIFMGLYFLLCILILPNMVYVSEGSSIALSSVSGTLAVVVGGIVLMIIGGIMARKTSPFLNY
jgi:predicted transporter